MHRAQKRISAAFLAGAALTMLPAAAVQAGVVVSVSGPSASAYPVGKKIANNTQITLKAGDVVTVLDRGSTRVLRGAGKFSLGARRRTGNRSAFSALTRQRSAQRVRTGAVRGGPGAVSVTRPNLWYVDVAQSGTHCLANGKNVRLWRSTTEGQITYNVSMGEQSQSVSFEDGEMVVPLKFDALPFSSGLSYSIGMDGAGSGSGASAVISFVVLDKVSRNAENLAEQLIENGCMSQLDLLASETLVEEAGAAGN